MFLFVANFRTDETTMHHVVFTTLKGNECIFYVYVGLVGNNVITNVCVYRMCSKTRWNNKSVYLLLSISKLPHI